MTPALQKMVEAMAAEIARQITSGEAEIVVGEYDTPSEDAVDLRSISLEKVARAGLKAIREPDVPLILAGADMDDSVGVWWPRLVEAILTH